MSRIGKKPVTIPAGVKVHLTDAELRVEGPNGKLALPIDPRVRIGQEKDLLVCTRSNDEKPSRALHGLYRSLVQNMMIGVTTGFQRKLEIVGVGYGAVLEGKSLKITIGFSTPARVTVPEGVTVALPDPTHIVISGADKQQVGHFAAVVRSVRKPEPYKGFGIRYEGEQVRRKAGKAFGSAGS